MVLSTAYFPPVEYFAALAEYSSVYLDDTEHYQKQSYRNRCHILTANGPEALTFPIVHDGTKRITEVRVDYSTPWLRRTEYALDSAYYSSPFFEYYRDELFAVLDARPAKLWDLNLSIMEFLCRKIGLPVPEFLSHASFTTGAVPSGTSLRSSLPAGAGSLPFTSPRVAAVPDGTASVAGRGTESEFSRMEIHPKVKSEYVGREYWQVFRDKFGFVRNMSVADLLFNEGPESLCYLK